MARSSNIRDVASRANVSLGTVSNVLNHPDIVAPATRERVEAAIRDLGFVRSEPARHLRDGQSRTLGLVVLDVGNPFFTDVARAVDEMVSPEGIALFLCSTDDDGAREQRYVRLLLEQRVRGLIIVPTTGSEDVAQLAQRRGVPIVLLDHAGDPQRICSVSVDDVAGSRLAMRHLLDQGHRRVAFVGDAGAKPQVAERRVGAQQAFADAGRDPEQITMIDVRTLTVAGGREAGRQLLQHHPRARPTAALCANDLLALGLLQEMTLAGVAVPADLAIVGYDDIDFAAAAAVPLSSVKRPRHLLGRKAAELVLEESSGQPHRHQRVVFEPELVVRTSSDLKRRRSPAGRARTVKLPRS